MQTNQNSKRIAHGAMVAALYVVLTLVFAPISFGAVQLRVSEALSIMPMFGFSAVWGLFVGCLLANILGGAVLLDVIFGSLATLIGAIGGYLLRKNRWLVPVPAIVSNAVIVPFVLKYGYGVDMPIWIMMLYVAAGEIISCYILGEIFASILKKNKNVFRKVN